MNKTFQVILTLTVGAFGGYWLRSRLGYRYPTGLVYDPDQQDLNGQVGQSGSSSGQSQGADTSQGTSVNSKFRMNTEVSIGDIASAYDTYAQAASGKYKQVTVSHLKKYTNLQESEYTLAIKQMISYALDKQWDSSKRYFDWIEWTPEASSLFQSDFNKMRSIVVPRNSHSTTDNSAGQTNTNSTIRSGNRRR